MKSCFRCSSECHFPSQSGMFPSTCTDLVRSMTYLPTSSDHMLRQFYVPSHTKMSASSGQVSPKKPPTKGTQASLSKVRNGPRRRHSGSKEALVTEPQSQISQASSPALSDRDLLTFERNGHLITKAALSQEETSLLGQVSLPDLPYEGCFCTCSVDGN